MDFPNDTVAGIGLINLATGTVLTFFSFGAYDDQQEALKAYKKMGIDPTIVYRFLMMIEVGIVASLTLMAIGLTLLSVAGIRYGLAGWQRELWPMTVATVSGLVLLFIISAILAVVMTQINRHFDLER